MIIEIARVSFLRLYHFVFTIEVIVKNIFKRSLKSQQSIILNFFRLRWKQMSESYRNEWEKKREQILLMYLWTCDFFDSMKKSKKDEPITIATEGSGKHNYYTAGKKKFGVLFIFSNWFPFFFSHFSQNNSHLQRKSPNKTS